MERSSLRGTERIDIWVGPILFNIFLSDFFLVVKDVNFPSYTDDNTIYKSGRNVDDVTKDLQLSAEKQIIII